MGPFRPFYSDSVQFDTDGLSLLSIHSRPELSSGRNYLPPLSATFVEAVNGLFLQGDGDCDERVVSARCHGLEVA